MSRRVIEAMAHAGESLTTRWGTVQFSPEGVGQVVIPDEDMPLLERARLKYLGEAEDQSGTEIPIEKVAATNGRVEFLEQQVRGLEIALAKRTEGTTDNVEYIKALEQENAQLKQQLVDAGATLQERIAEVRQEVMQEMSGGIGAPRMPEKGEPLTASERAMLITPKAEDGSEGGTSFVQAQADAVAKGELPKPTKNKK